MSASVKYPRTPHLPFSPAYSHDDEQLVDINFLKNEKEIIITEKMDGENTSLYPDHWHGRSINSNRKHESRDYMAGRWAQLRSRIPEGFRVCGENMYAKHSIHYPDLSDWFLGFSIWNGDMCASWDETIDQFLKIGIWPVKQLYRGPFSFEALTTAVAKLNLNRQEGIVVRTTTSFEYSKFNHYVAKWVRYKHVESETKHWFSSKVTKNRIK